MIDTSDKEAARILKDTDKEMALNDKYVCAACFDLQKVLFSTKNSLLGKMGEYEKEQARLQELMQDVIDEETKDVLYNDDEEEGEVDHVEVHEENSDAEQELEPTEELEENSGSF
jgi:hypothetical protein